jgi:hypothetical protein
MLRAPLRQMVLESRVALHRRVNLPGDQDGFLASRVQVRQADEVPLHIGADIDKLRIFIRPQGFPRLGWRDILNHSERSEL